jgi:hypothetical protein
MQKDTKSLRRSSRLAFHPPNQSYKSKQGRHRISKRQRRGSKQSRRHKDGQIESKMMKAHHMEDIREARKAEQEKRMEIRKAKLQGRRHRDKKLTLRSVQPAINDSANCEPANGGPTIDHTMIEPTFCDPLELESANGEPANDEPANGEPTIDDTMIEPTFCDPLELEPANDEPANDGPTIDHTMIEPTFCDPLELESANGEPENDEPANDGPTIDHTMIEPTFCDPLELESANGEPENDEPENGEPTIDHTMIEPTLCDPLELDLANGQRIDADTSKLAHDDGMAMLDEYYRNSPVDLGCVDGILAFDTLTHQSPPTDDLDTTLNASECARLQNSDHLLETHKTNMNPPCTTLKAHEVKHVVQDESGHLVADVVEALGEASDTSRIPDSYTLGVSEVFCAENTSMEFSKVMSSLVVNGATCVRRIARTALDIEQERLRMHERDQLERIAEDRQQMNMNLAQRTASEMSY